jgi:RNA polymerase sigma-54 factor
MVGMQMGQTQRVTVGLHQSLRIAQQAWQARLLEMSDVGHEAWIAQQLRENPALRRRAAPPPLRDHATSSPARPDGDEIPYDYSWTKDADLETHLTEQLRLQRANEAEQAAAFVIIQNLDRFGLLLISLEEVARLADVDESDAEDGQALVMELEPEGCGATDIQHYISEMVRKRHKQEERKQLLHIVGTWFDELKQKNYERIHRLENIPLELVESYAKMIAAIPPFPAQGFAEADPTSHVVPTVFVTRQPNGRIEVDVQDPPRSRIELNQKWVDAYNAMPTGPEKRAMKAYYEEAQEVLTQIETRYSLLAKVANHAIQKQRAFFLYGEEHMVNLTMEEVASAIGEKRPNISRTVKERYYLFEGRSFRLRDLFSHRGAGDRPSKLKLHAVLREIVAEEDPAHPLSDSELADALKARGFREARRTVAKHRELAGIPAVHKRRQSKPPQR